MRLLLSTMFAFCIVGCVADEPKTAETSNELSLADTNDSAVIGVEDGADIATSGGGGVDRAFTFSFFATCNGESVTITGSGSAVTGASATSCRRRNGTFTGFVSWSGFCTGDIANCDGRLRCGGC